MIVQLDITNNLPVTIVINSNSATGQPLVPGQVLQAMFSLETDSDGIAHINLFIDRE
jgi:polyhydroxyalkanoate synthesis regulator protein